MMSVSTSHSYLRVAEQVRAALVEGRAVVALESTVIAHGLPRPANLEVARAMEDAVRAEGAVPATVALLDGQIVVGLNDAEIERLGSEEQVLKASRRDLAPALARRATAATTVAGTLACAALAGIRVFATGGIGGVHRGAVSSFDVSADLIELSRAPVLTVCAGAKAILDLPLTLEYLETHGVPVVGFQTDELPAFYSRASGLRTPHRADTAQEVAATAYAQWASGVGGGLLVTCPIPEAFALPSDAIEKAITTALREAVEQGVHGPATTPFLLARVAELTGGESVAANRALLLNNAMWAGRFASELSKIRTITE
ncbi:MAG: Pseudouridine 5'-phosphate glycosidase [Ktedonobacterales bacterium]|jgi:pseudouridine-5'-phosphate glycosidase|nr:MAG: Pseudouridine 5'-phosphate glycosidase [Ktedonobacterales bacterium]